MYSNQMYCCLYVHIMILFLHSLPSNDGRTRVSEHRNEWRKWESEGGNRCKNVSKNSYILKKIFLLPIFVLEQGDREVWIGEERGRQELGINQGPVIKHTKIYKNLTKSRNQIFLQYIEKKYSQNYLCTGKFGQVVVLKKLQLLCTLFY